MELMTWREACEADLVECLAIEPRHLGDEIVGRERALAIWKELLQTRAFHSCVVESASLPGRILGFGASVFVTADFASREIENPRPGLNSRIFASIADGRSVARSEADLYNTSVHDPLDVVTLYASWPEEGLSAEQLGEVQMLLAFGYVELHSGYRLNRLLVECIGAAQCDYVESSGVWRTAKKFAERGHHFSVMTREDAFSVSGSIAPSLFQYQEPVLGLRESERLLLVEALTRQSDTELAKRMNLSPATVKKRWQSLFERIADIRPELLPDESNGTGSQSRGPQKRHRILAYVRSHPQELRPYRWHSA
jgi:DNA-binding CsgD family transcriptional regulator